MVTNTYNDIYEYINKNGQASIVELFDHFKISRQAIFKHINRLQKEGLIYKIGRSPKVFYLPKTPSIDKNISTISQNKKEIIDENYLIITPDGQRLEGVIGFEYWCNKQNLPVEKTADEYINTLEKYNKYKKEGLINATTKIKDSFREVGLDTMYYKDFYSIERFGKTKLGQILLYAKQSQDRSLIKEISDIIKPSIVDMIKENNIDAIGFIPPTVKREVQLMRELERSLSISLPIINLVKIKGDVTIPQKTLNKIEDRMENARKSIIIDDKKVYNNILLIDDAVGSGATLNETAIQVKNKHLCKGKIIGLAITGSFKGFDVISEV